MRRERRSENTFCLPSSVCATKPYCPGDVKPHNATWKQRCALMMQALQAASRYNELLLNCVKHVYTHTHTLFIHVWGKEWLHSHLNQILEDIFLIWKLLLNFVCFLIRKTPSLEGLYAREGHEKEGRWSQEEPLTNNFNGALYFQSSFKSWSGPPSDPGKVGQHNIFTGEETEIQCSGVHPTRATRVGTQISGFPSGHTQVGCLLPRKKIQAVSSLYFIFLYAN